jgi:glycine cleavage system regulatory protein
VAPNGGTEITLSGNNLLLIINSIKVPVSQETSILNHNFQFLSEELQLLQIKSFRSIISK